MRRLLALLCVAALGACTTGPGTTPGATASMGSTQPMAFSWDGQWRGVSSGGGRTTTVRIAGGKVIAWTNNGFPRDSVSGSVGTDRVSLDDNNGWTATMVRQSDGSAVITASGIGQNGLPARNRAVLTKG